MLVKELHKESILDEVKIDLFKQAMEKSSEINPMRAILIGKYLGKYGEYDVMLAEPEDEVDTDYLILGYGNEPIDTGSIPEIDGDQCSLFRIAFKKFGAFQRYALVDNDVKRDKGYIALAKAAQLRRSKNVRDLLEECGLKSLRGIRVKATRLFQYDPYGVEKSKLLRAAMEQDGVNFRNDAVIVMSPDGELHFVDEEALVDGSWQFVAFAVDVITEGILDAYRKNDSFRNEVERFFISINRNVPEFAEYIVHHVRHNLPFVSDSAMEKAYDRFLIDYYSSLTKRVENDELSPLLALSLMQRFVPESQKTTYLQNYYINAEDARIEAMERVMLKIKPHQMELFNDDLKRIWKRAHAREQEFVRLDGDNLMLFRREKKDHWFLKYKDEVSPYWVRLGHLGRSKIKTNHKVFDYPDGTRKIVLNVLGRDSQLKCEIYNKDGKITFTPWILNGYGLDEYEDFFIFQIRTSTSTEPESESDRFEIKRIDDDILKVVDKKGFYPTTIYHTAGTVYVKKFSHLKIQPLPDAMMEEVEEKFL